MEARANTNREDIKVPNHSNVLYWPTVAKIPITGNVISREKKIFEKERKIEYFRTINYEAELAAGAYDNGIALVLGKTLEFPDVYSAAIDIDGKDAVQAWFGPSWDNVTEAAQHHRIEWHGQNKDSLHIIFLCKGRPIKNKVIKISDTSQIEIKCEGLLLFACPSIMPDGCPWVHINSEHIPTLNEQKLVELEARIDTLCQGYMSDEDKQRYIQWLEQPSTKFVGEGSGRHNALVTLGTSYFYRYSNGWKDLTDDQRRDKLWKWNLDHCDPPKPEGEFNDIWKWIMNHHRRNRDQQFEELRNKSKEQEESSHAKIIAQITDELMQSYTFKTMKDTRDIYCYDKERGIFVNEGRSFIESYTESVNSEITTYQVNEIINHIIRRTLTDREDFDKEIQWLVCNNCVINLRTGESRPFSSEFMSTNHIPVNYVAYNREHVHTLNDFRRPNGIDPYVGYNREHAQIYVQICDFFRLVECPCPKIMKFLYEIMSAEDVEVFLDYLAYCLWRNYKFNFWMLLNGAGFNGKSILLNLIERFLGKENVSGETLNRLLNHERFSVASLYGKMANVDADVSADFIFNNTGIIKKLTGNDLHAGEFKFKTPFAFRNHAKLFFSCNKIPDTEDFSDAFFRRILIINFTQQFFGEKEDPHLIDKKCTEEEFSGLLYELVSRLPRVLSEGIKKTTSEGMAQTYEKYTRGSNPVKYFVEKTLLFPVSGSKISKLDLYKQYEEFCRDFGLAPESPQSFSRKLKEDHHLEIKRGRINGERVYCWTDVQIRDWKKEELENDKLENLEDFS